MTEITVTRARARARTQRESHILLALIYLPIYIDSSLEMAYVENYIFHSDNNISRRNVKLPSFLLHVSRPRENI